MAAFTTQMAARGPFAQTAPVPIHAAPPGTFVPGTKVQVGSHRVVIEKYLSEGGFAHVYVVRLPTPVDGTEKAVLKRVAVPDKENLANMRTEVETMKRLKGQSKIVKYFDSHASQLKGGGYEVFLLMEYCQGGGLIDFMNTRLQNRLTEPEILKIFTDVAEGVACMHYLKPPLLHRDLKVENVLISVTGSTRSFKLCDFGSTAPPRPAATTAAEGRLIEDDVQRHTTLQYRSPEMIDVYRKQPIDEKSDIWALGVLLYKLCYYTTPFEEVGQMAILNASFKYPGYPRFSDGLKLLIASMLREHPAKRPNIFEVLSQVCKMQGKPVPVKDIYTGRSHSEARKSQQLPPSPSDGQQRAGATLSLPKPQTGPSIPDIAPMRRGRPDKPVSHHGSAKPSPSPLRMIDLAETSDPFAALDGGKATTGDELSSKFPTLDQFSLLTDPGKKFDFETKAPKKEPDSKAIDLSQRVTYALADDAFARAPSPKPKSQAAISVGRSKTVIERKKGAEGMELSSASQSGVDASGPSKVGTGPDGTMASPAPSSSLPNSVSGRPIYRFPSHEYAPAPTSSRPRIPDKSRLAMTPAEADSRLANLLRDDASKSQGVDMHEPMSAISSRPSLETGRPSMRDLGLGLHRSRSLNIRNRPLSVNIGARPTHIRDQDIRKTDYPNYHKPHGEADSDMSPLTAVESDKNIPSEVDFLKMREEEERHHRKSHHKRLSSSGSRHGKRASLPSVGLSSLKGTTSSLAKGTTTLLTGRFGDAFRRFEGHHDQRDSPHHHHRRQSSSPMRNNVLTPIAGSEATDLSDDRHGLDLMETEDLSPEMRRELEKHHLEVEERRVATAAAEYRRRVAEKGGGRDRETAKSIQNKVQSLLQENEKPITSKSATGYGRFTDANGAAQAARLEDPLAEIPPFQQADTRGRGLKSTSAPPSALDLPAQNVRVAQRPMAPPKPKVLRTGRAEMTASPGPMNGGETALSSPGDDWEENFSKRYPSLSGLEMVETDIDARSKVVSLRTKEV